MTTPFPALFDLSGKRALVTGGTRGIGLMIARGLLDAGASVVISSRKQDAVDAAVEELRAHGEVSGIAADVSRADAVPDAMTHPAAVLVAGRLDPASIACVFLDEDEAEVDVKDAVQGDDDAAERLADRTLLWFDLAEVLQD